MQTVTTIPAPKGGRRPPKVLTGNSDVDFEWAPPVKLLGYFAFHSWCDPADARVRAAHCPAVVLSHLPSAEAGKNQERAASPKEPHLVGKLLPARRS